MSIAAQFLVATFMVTLVYWLADDDDERLAAG